MEEADISSSTGSGARIRWTQRSNACSVTVRLCIRVASGLPSMPGAIEPPMRDFKPRYKIANRALRLCLHIHHLHRFTECVPAFVEGRKEAR